MARKARVEFPGALYHVLDRGDRREAIFRDERDRQHFLATRGEACGRTGWRLHAFVLMSNHYHLMLETPQANLVAGMRWFQTTVTARFNRRHRLSGHLFQGRYKAVVVDPGERGYFGILSDYIHLNPVRARLVTLDARLVDFTWSSYRHYVLTAGRPAWLRTDAVLGELGLADDAPGRRAYAERMRRRAVEELAGAERPERQELRRGWCLGGPGFRERMLALLEATGERLGTRTRRDAVVEQDHGEEAARRLLESGLEMLGLRAGDLPELLKGDPRKLALAALIRCRTAVPNAWIAQELCLGHVSRVGHAGRLAAESPWTKKTRTTCDHKFIILRMKPPHALSGTVLCFPARMVYLLRALLFVVAIFLVASNASGKTDSSIDGKKEGGLAIECYYGLRRPQNFNEAYKHASAGSLQDDSSAVVIRALCLGRARGVTQDQKEALRLLRPLLNKDDPFANAAAAVFEGQGRRLDESLPPVIEAAFRNELAALPPFNPQDKGRHAQNALAGLKAARMQGDAIALLVSGQLLAWGAGVKKDEPQAMEYFQRAWDLGCSDAGNQIGLLFQEGEIARRDHAEAMRWFQKAADLGNAVAKMNLATFQTQEEATGVTRQRRTLLESAAAVGYPDAMCALGEALWSGREMVADKEKGRQWLEKAASYETRRATETLGLILFGEETTAAERVRGCALLKKAAVLGSENAAYALGQAAVLKRPGVDIKPEVGFILAWAAAEGSIADAWSTVGIAFQNGSGVMKDAAQASVHFRKGIERGSSRCSYHLGMLMLSQKLGAKNDAEAFAHILKAAEAGLADGMREAGQCLLHGRGVAKDQSAALTWLRRAAEHNDLRAELLLGFAYENGWGSAVNPGAAAKAYRKAAEGDISAGMNMFALCLQKGFGTEKNLAEALSWLRRGSKMGDLECLFNLAFAYENGLGVETDLQEAWKYYLQAAEQGVPRAWTTVGDWHRLGRLGPPSISDAVRCYERATELGDPTGTNNLGYCYQIGAGVASNPNRAFTLFSQAAELGAPTGLVNMAICYEKGIGVAVDLVKARELREKAAKMQRR